MPPQAPSRESYSGGPAVRVTVPVLRWPDGVTQVTDTVLPGWNFDSAACRESGVPTAWPLTLVTTDPAAIPAVVAGLPQMVPMTRVPELTGAMVEGTGRLVSLL